jgi:hypothetical protein
MNLNPRDRSAQSKPSSSNTKIDHSALTLHLRKRVFLQAR